MQKLWDFITTFWERIGDVLEYLLDGAVYLLMVVVRLILDGFLTVVYLSVASIDLGSFVFNAAAAWTGMDPQIVWVINGLGIPTCLTILGGAYVIRFGLNLIPAALTRV